jgi:hypothetical protein
VEGDSVVDSRDIALVLISRSGIQNKAKRGKKERRVPAILADTTDAVFKTLAEGMVVCHRGETSASSAEF